jgi:hypothetical protein
MRTSSVICLLAGTWLVVAAIVWFTLVPAVLSPAVFAGVNAAALVLVAAAAWIALDTAPARSLAGLLYDTEHPRHDRNE